MLKHVLLLCLVGLSVSSVVDPVPHPDAIGGHGEFIHDPVHDVVPASAGVIPSPVHDIISGPRYNGAVHDVVHDVVPRSGSVVHDVVPRSGSFVVDVVHDQPYAAASVHDNVPSSRSVVHDVVPTSGSVVHDVVPNSRSFAHDVIPSSRSVVHDVVPNSRSVGHGFVPRYRPVVHDVAHNVPHAAGAVRNVVPAIGQHPFIQAGHPFHGADNGIGSSPVAPSARYADPNALKCGLRPEPFIAYQLSRFSYNYPRYEILNEFEHRPSIRPSVLALATNGRFSRRSYGSQRNNVFQHRTKGDAVTNGCVGRPLILRSFFAYNNYCWLVAPVYQDVTYYHCYQGCYHQSGYGTVSRCEASYTYRKVLAYCAGLPYGKRIGHVNIPIPTGCSCKTYNCS